MKYYQPYVYVVLKNLGASHHDCEDLCQDVMLKAWKALPSYQYQQKNCKFRTWLCVICRNCLRSFVRSRDSRQQREQRSTEEILAQDLQVDAEIEELAEKEWRSYISKLAWENVRNSFSENVQTCFLLLLEGKATAEVASQLELADSSVRVNKKRVTAALCKEIVRLDNQLEF